MLVTSPPHCGLHYYSGTLASRKSPLGSKKSPGGSKPRKNKKAEEAAKAAMEHAKKFGVACIPIQIKKFFAGRDLDLRSWYFYKYEAK